MNSNQMKIFRNTMDDWQTQRRSGCWLRRLVSHDWFKANVAGACEAMMMLHYALALPLAMCGQKWAGIFMLIAGCVWMQIARGKRERIAVEKARREWQRQQMAIHG
jgi:hypothetical protein